MSEMPEVSPGDWIAIGENEVPAVVCGPCRQHPDGPRVEVVFRKEKPTNLYVRWAGDHWEFVPSPDEGGYADRYDRLGPFVAKLKYGAPYSP